MVALKCKSQQPIHRCKNILKIIIKKNSKTKKKKIHSRKKYNSRNQNTVLKQRNSIKMKSLRKHKYILEIKKKIQQETLKGRYDGTSLNGWRRFNFEMRIFFSNVSSVLVWSGASPAWAAWFPRRNISFDPLYLHQYHCPKHCSCNMLQ